MLGTILYLIFAVIFIWLLRLMVLYMHIGSYKKYWQLQNTLPDQKNQLIYVALGDSTAQGIGASSPKTSYPYLTKKWLENNTSKPVKLLNFSVSGAKVEDCLKDQLPQLMTLKPDYVTIEIGANDIKTFNAEKFKTEFTELVSKLPASTYISDIPAFTGRAKKLDPVVVAANKIIAECLKGSKLTYVALYEATKTNTGISYFSPDYFHPNNKAYRTWAKAFTAALQTRFSK